MTKHLEHGKAVEQPDDTIEAAYARGLAEGRREGAEAMREAAVVYAKQRAESDHSTAAQYPDEAHIYDFAAHRSEVIAKGLAALPLPEGETGWRPIESAPTGDEIFYAATADGRQMIVRGSILANMRRKDTPNHLQFPAVYWMPLLPLPSPPKE